MIKSMTGFASVSHEDERALVGVTVRAVNHRYLDLQLRLPSAVAPCEPALRTLVQGRVARGRIEVSVTVQPREAPVPQVQLNAGFLAALQAALQDARGAGLIDGALTPGDLLRLPHALTFRETIAEDEGTADAISRAVEHAVAAGLEAVDRMRVHEGTHLHADLSNRRQLLASLIERLAAAAEAGRAALEARLHERVRDLIGDLQVDRLTLGQEIVRTAARSDITEEVTRFKGHLLHWDALTDSPEPCGRKLDFLLQEMNREINTIGSKADGIAVSEIIVTTKAELEKMREQVQNVE
jgi:uncharacterized protein (TIGR00255 family)